MQNKKVDILKRKICLLESKLKDMENKNRLLSMENDSLKKMNDANRESIALLSSELISIKEEHNSALAGLSTILFEYNRAISDVRVLGRKYKKEMDRFMKRINN